jgi:hypothetical protein
VGATAFSFRSDRDCGRRIFEPVKQRFLFPAHDFKITPLHVPEATNLLG